MKKSFYSFALLFALTISVRCVAQFEIANSEYIDEIKGQTTYIAMKDTGTVMGREYKALFRKYWTFSNVRFVNYKDVPDKIEKGVSFFTIGGYETTTQFTTLYSNGSSKNGIDYSTTHIYFELWTGSDKYFEKSKKEFGDKDKIRIARIELFTDFPTLMNPDNIYQADCDGGGHIRNWGPGIIRNYIQALMSLLKAGDERKLYDGSADDQQLKKLKSDTLLIPDYVLIKFNKFTGDETERHGEKEIFEDYGHKYKLVKMDDLNEKIKQGKKPFYYFVYIKSCTDKFITVLNSETGEIIYTTYTPVSYNISSKDLKKLSDAVDGD